MRTYKLHGAGHITIETSSAIICTAEETEHYSLLIEDQEYSPDLSNEAEEAAKGEKGDVTDVAKTLPDLHTRLTANPRLLYTNSSLALECLNDGLFKSQTSSWRSYQFINQEFIPQMLEHNCFQAAVEFALGCVPIIIAREQAFKSQKISSQSMKSHDDIYTDFYNDPDHPSTINVTELPLSFGEHTSIKSQDLPGTQLKELLFSDLLFHTNFKTDEHIQNAFITLCRDSRFDLYTMMNNLLAQKISCAEHAEKSSRESDQIMAQRSEDLYREACTLLSNNGVWLWAPHSVAEQKSNTHAHPTADAAPAAAAPAPASAPTAAPAASAASAAAPAPASAPTAAASASAAASAPAAAPTTAPAASASASAASAPAAASASDDQTTEQQPHTAATATLPEASHSCSG
jgi:hypothetical protein